MKGWNSIKGWLSKPAPVLKDTSLQQPKTSKSSNKMPESSGPRQKINAMRIKMLPRKTEISNGISTRNLKICKTALNYYHAVTRAVSRCPLYSLFANNFKFVPIELIEKRTKNCWNLPQNLKIHWFNNFVSIWIWWFWNLLVKSEMFFFFQKSKF